MSENFTLEILLAGESVSPGCVRSKEIAELIEALEDMVAAVVVLDHPELKKEAVVIGLKGLYSGSLGLQFAPNLVELTLPATRRIANAIADNDFGKLPSGAIKALRKLSAFTRRHQCNAEFITQSNQRSEKIAILTPNTCIPDIYPLSGETSLYGEITRVGGAEPKIQFRTLDGKVIYCSTSKAVAQQAGSNLYKQVELRGIAEWNAETFEIEGFRAIEITDYTVTSPVNAFKALKQLVGPALDEIQDVDRFVSEMRYGLPEA